MIESSTPRAENRHLPFSPAFDPLAGETRILDRRPMERARSLGRRRAVGFGSILSVAVAACSDDANPARPGDAGSTRDAMAGDARSDAGESQTGVTSPAPPMLTPCPGGWAERSIDAGPTVCEPWPDVPLVRWSCPAGWAPIAGEDGEWCDPGPDWSPVSWPCPEGWRVEAREGVQSCEPYPVGGPEPCEAGEMHFPGEPGCTSVGPACPDGRFAADLPADATIVYVDPDADRGGDGSSPGSAFRLLDDIDFDALPRGALVALAKGTHVGQWSLGRTVTLWGACSAQTVLRSNVAASSPAAVVFIEGNVLRRPVVTLRNLTVSGSPRLGVTVDGPASVRLSGIVVDSVRDTGVRASDGASVELHSVVVRNTQPSPSGDFGWALDVFGATAEAKRIVLEGNRSIGVIVEGRSRLTMEDGVIRDTQSRSDTRTEGWGLDLEAGSSAELRRVLLERNRDVAILVIDDSTLRMEDAIVRTTRPLESNGRYGRGLEIQPGSTAELRRVLFEGNREVSIVAGGDLVMNDAIVRDTESQLSDRKDGNGLVVQDGAHATIGGALFDNQRAEAIVILAPGSRLDLADALVRRTRAREADGLFGRGSTVQQGAEANLERVVFDANRNRAVVAFGEGTRLKLSTSIVRNTRSQASDGIAGIGVAVEGGAQGELRDLLLENNQAFGLVASGDGTGLTVDNVIVRGTVPRTRDDAFGYGVQIQLGADAQLRRLVARGNRGAAVSAVARGTLSLEDAILRDTRGLVRAPFFGSGLNVVGSDVQARRLLVEGNQTDGISVSNSRLVLEDAVIRDSRSREASGDRGIGLGVGQGSIVEIRRLHLRRNRHVAFFAQGEGTQLSAWDVVIRDTESREGDGEWGYGALIEEGSRADLRRHWFYRHRGATAVVRRAETSWADVRLVETRLPACADAPTCDSTAHALAVIGTSTVRVERAILGEAEQCGILVSSGRPGDPAPRLDLTDTLFRDNLTAACVDADGLDLSALDGDSVAYVDNEQNLQIATFPAPSPVELNVIDATAEPGEQAEGPD